MGRRHFLVTTNATVGNPYEQGCPTRRILDRIGDRWTVLIVGALGENTLRFSEIKRRIEGISQKMLTHTLRGLEEDGLVTRTVTAEVPVRVDYRLTAAGQSLRAPLKALEDWSIENLGHVLDARAEHQSRAEIAR